MTDEISNEPTTLEDALHAWRCAAASNEDSLRKLEAAIQRAEEAEEVKDRTVDRMNIINREKAELQVRVRELDQVKTEQIVTLLGAEVDRDAALAIMRDHIDDVDRAADLLEIDRPNDEVHENLSKMWARMRVALAADGEAADG